MSQRVQDEINAGVERGDHLGAQVFASVSGETVMDHAFGESRPGVAMTPDTVALWMSAGKPVTAVAIAQRVEAGRIGLDDPVAEYLPGFEVNGKEDITVRHVLTHTGGFRAAQTTYPGDSWETAVRAVCDARQEPGWGPGERAGYHVHTGWTVLGRLIEAASGQAFPEYTRTKIFEPLGMDRCWTGMPRETHRRLGEQLAVMPDTSSVEAGAFKDAGLATEDWCAGVRPGGNAYGPANQLGRFYEMLLPPTPGSPSRDEAGTLDGVTIVSPESARLFTSRQREGMTDRTFRHVMDWGLGFMIDSKRHQTPGGPPAPYGYGPHASDAAFGHGGNQCAAGLADPAHGLAAVVLFNGMPGEVRHQARLHRFLGVLYEELGLA